jgi:hypothetical protein
MHVASQALKHKVNGASRLRSREPVILRPRILESTESTTPLTCVPCSWCVLAALRVSASQLSAHVKAYLPGRARVCAGHHNNSLIKTRATHTATPHNEPIVPGHEVARFLSVAEARSPNADVLHQAQVLHLMRHPVRVRGCVCVSVCVCPCVRVAMDARKASTSLTQHPSPLPPSLPSPLGVERGRQLLVVGLDAADVVGLARLEARHELVHLVKG